MRTLDARSAAIAVPASPADPRCARAALCRWHPRSARARRGGALPPATHAYATHRPPCTAGRMAQYPREFSARQGALRRNRLPRSSRPARHYYRSDDPTRAATRHRTTAAVTCSSTARRPLLPACRDTRPGGPVPAVSGLHPSFPKNNLYGRCHQVMGARRPQRRVLMPRGMHHSRITASPRTSLCAPARALDGHGRHCLARGSSL